MMLRSETNLPTTPRCHEGVGDVETSWNISVPSANALLLASRHDPDVSEEFHFVSAFLTVEGAHNLCVQPGCTKSPDQLMGFGLPDDMVSFYAYGSPVKMLVHPEARDHKFQDHAIGGTYRGPSRVNESKSCCSVWDGRIHRPVDKGMMRIDEREIICRSNRGHVSHQPFSLNAPGMRSQP